MADYCGGSLQDNSSLPIRFYMNAQDAKELQVVCSCGCKTQVLISDWEGGELTINVRPDGRYLWIGAVLKKDDVQKLKSFLKDIE